MSFTLLDWASLALYLLVVMSVGMYFSSRQTSTQEFFLGGRRFKALAVSLSVLATGTSAISFLGVPGFVIERDWSTLFASLMGIPATLLVAWLFVPFFYNLRLTSTYEYLQRRFDTKCAVLGGVLFFFLRGLLAGIAIYAPSIALCAVTGWNLTWCIVLSGLLTLFYTTLGGMSAVVWNDILQASILYSGAILVLVQVALRLPGNAGDWFHEAAADHKFNLFDFHLSWVHLTFWGAAIGGLFYNVAFYGVDQVLVQRYLASKSLKDAQKSLYLNSIYAIPTALLFFIIGTMLYLYLKHNRAAFPGTLSSDQVFPYYIVRHMPPGLPGVMVAAIYAAAMGTLSSVLNSLSTVSVNDFYKRFWRSHETEEHYVKLGRRLTGAWGLLAIVTGLLAVHMDPSVWMQAIKAGGLFMGPLLGMFLLGMLSARVTGRAAFWGCLFGGCVSLLAGFASPLEMFWLTLFGTAVTIVAGGVLSLLWPAEEAAKEAVRPLTFAAFRRQYRLTEAGKDAMISIPLNKGG
jgi:SSS family transporter